MKHPLARALKGAGLTRNDVASRLGVDPKTVDRWMSGRTPYPRYRTALRRMTGWAEADLWPAGPPDERASSDELVCIYGQRSAVPVEVWRRLLGEAVQKIGILAYSGLFLAEDATAQRLLRERARAGVPVRIVLGALNGEQVGRRGAEEGIEEAMSAKIRNALVLYRALSDEPTVEVRQHDTVLYNSIYRADDQLLVNAHVYGQPASHAPVLHLRRTCGGGMADTYLHSFEQVWASSRVVG